MFLTSRRAIFLLAGALFLGACATSYQSQGFTGGYRDQRITDSAFKVAFSGNGNTSKERVWYFFMYRCAELTLRQKFTYFVIRTEDDGKSASIAPHERLEPAAARPGSGLSVRPAVYRAGARPADGSPGAGARARELQVVPTSSVPIFIWIPGGPGPTKWTYHGMVLMFPDPLPDTVVWAYDARKMIELLKPYIAADGNISPPSSEALLKTALTGHATVVAPGRIRVTSAADADAAPSDPPRAAREIRDHIKFDRYLLLHKAYWDHVRRTHEPDTGTVTLSLTIAPHGDVTDCHAVSSTFADAAFVKDVVESIRATPFGPQQVAPSTVDGFTVAFLRPDQSGADAGLGDLDDPPPDAVPAAPDAGGKLTFEIANADYMRQGGIIEMVKFAQTSDDVALDGAVARNGELVVTGQIGRGHGSAWGGLGPRFYLQPHGAPMDVSRFGSVTVRVSASTRELRIGAVGSDEEARNTGCYPVYALEVSEDMKEYTIPLSKFSPESRCRAEPPARTWTHVVGFELVSVRVTQRPLTIHVGSITLNP